MPKKQINTVTVPVDHPLLTEDFPNEIQYEFNYALHNVQFRQLIGLGISLERALPSAFSQLCYRNERDCLKALDLTSLALLADDENRLYELQQFADAVKLSDYQSVSHDLPLLVHTLHAAEQQKFDHAALPALMDCLLTQAFPIAYQIAKEKLSNCLKRSAKYAYSHQDYTEAERLLAYAIYLNPMDMRARVMQSSIHMASKRYDLAVDQLTSILKNSPHYPEAYLLRSLALTNMGRTEDARNDEKKANALLPSEQATANISEFFDQFVLI